MHIVISFFIFIFRTAYNKQSESTKTAESKNHDKKQPDLLTQLESLKITNDESNKPEQAKVPAANPIVSDRDIFIPSEFGSCGQSQSVITVSASVSKPISTKTTDSKKQPN